MKQLELYAPERIQYWVVTCTDERGNAWRHRVADPEDTVREIEARWPDVKCEVRR